MGKKSETASTGNNYYASNACVLSVGPCERLVFVEVAGKEEYFSATGIDLTAASVPYSLELPSGRLRFYRGTSDQVVPGGTNPSLWPNAVDEGHPDYDQLVENINGQAYRPVPYNDPSKAILKLDPYSSNFRHLVIVEFDDFLMGFETHNFPAVRFGFCRVPDQNIVTGAASQPDSALQINPMALMAEAWTNKVYCLGRPENTLHQASWQAVADELHAEKQYNYISPKYTKPITFNQLVSDMAGYAGVYFRDNDQGQIVAGRFPQAEAAPVGIPVITDDDLEQGSEVRIVPTTTSAQASEFELSWTNPRLSFGEDKVKATSARNRPDPDLGETKEYKAPFIQRGPQATYQVNRKAALDSKTFFKISGIVLSENKADELELGEPFVLHLEYKGRTFQKICFPTKMVGSSETRMQVSIECESSRGYFSTQEFEDYVDEEVDPEDPIPEIPHWNIFQATGPMAPEPYSMFFLAARNDAKTVGFNGFFRSTSSEFQLVSQQRSFGIPLEVVSGPNKFGPKEEHTGNFKVKRKDLLNTLGWDSFPKALTDEQYENDEIYVLLVKSQEFEFYPERNVHTSVYLPRVDYQKFELMSLKFIGNAEGDLTDPTYEIFCRRSIGNTVSMDIEQGQTAWLVRKSEIAFFSHGLIPGMEKGQTEESRTGHFIIQPFRSDEKRDISEDNEKVLQFQRTKLDDMFVDAPLTGNAYLYEDSRGFSPQVHFRVTNLDPLITRLIVDYGPSVEAEAGVWKYTRFWNVAGRTDNTAEFDMRHNLYEGVEYRFRIRGHQSVGWPFTAVFGRGASFQLSTAGIYTDWVYPNPIVPVGKSANPTDPESFTLAAIPNGMEIRIPTHPDKDFKHYNVYVNSVPILPEDPSFTMNDSIRSINNLAAGQTYYVWIDAEDQDSNFSNVIGSQTVVPKPGVPSGGAILFTVPSVQAYNVNWTYSDYSPLANNAVPVMRVGGQVKSYSSAPLEDSWRYDASEFQVIGGDRNTSTSPSHALGILDNGNFSPGKQTIKGVAIYRDDLGIDWPQDFQVEWVQIRTGELPLSVHALSANIVLDPATSVAEAEASYNPAAHSITPQVKWAGSNVQYSSSPQNNRWRYGNLDYPHGNENLVLTDPSIGYTSVTQMPFQRIDFQVVYRDSEGVDHTQELSGTFTQQYVVYGQDGLPGANLSLVVASVTISTDEDGNGGDYTTAKTTYKVLLGETDDTEDWTISVVPTDCTHTHDTLNNEVSITSAQEDYAYVTITATKPGAADLVKRFAVFKSKNEAAADAAEALTKANQAIAEAGAAAIVANDALDSAQDAETVANNAVATAAADATAKADAAEAAAVSAAQITAEAYTDQEIDAEEARAIADATAKANAARDEAEATAATLADAAEVAAQAAAIAAAALDASNKANAAQQAAQDAAVVISNAYADGLVSAEEARAIADATAKANAARDEAVASASLVSQAQADEALADAIAAAALDATGKADTAQAQAIAAAALTSAAQASAAQDAAEAAAALDATQKSEAAAQEAQEAAVIAANAFADGLVSAEEARAIADATAKANAARDEAVASASADATAKADAAEAAAVLLAATQANAYADGIVTAEEVRAIADATTKADAAEAAAIAAAAADATAKANQAEQDAIAAASLDAATKSAAAQAAAIAAAAIDATAKADAAEAAASLSAETAANAYTDGLVSAEEARAIQDAIDKANAARDEAVASAAIDAQTRADAAEAAAEAAAVIAANAFADGLVSAEEARAIADATAKANAARDEAVAAAQIYADGTFLTEAVWGIHVVPPLRFQDVAVPNVSGLYSTDNYMGFHNGDGTLAGWRAYIQSDGQVFFGNPSGQYIAWDNSTFTIRGTLDGTVGTFSGDLAAAGGTFSGNLAGASGTFSGDLSASGGTFSGDLLASGGTFNGDLSAAGGTFSGDLIAAGGTFSGNLSAASGSFSGSVDILGSSTIQNNLHIGTGGSILSELWVSDLQGFNINQNGSAEFNESFKVTNEADSVYFRVGTPEGGGILVQTPNFELTSTGINLQSINSEIKSNFVEGVSGFRLNGHGTSEINNIILRGSLISVGEFTLDDSGFIWGDLSDYFTALTSVGTLQSISLGYDEGSMASLSTTIHQSGTLFLTQINSPNNYVLADGRGNLTIKNSGNGDPFRVEKHSSWQIYIDQGGILNFDGPGYPNLRLYGDSPNILRTDENFQVSENLYLGNTDCYLRRESANRIYTPDSFYVGGTFYLGSTDCYIQRQAADRMYTPDSFHLGGTLYIGNLDSSIFRNGANYLRTSDLFHADRMYSDSHYDFASGNDHAVRFWGGNQSYSINMSERTDGTHGGRLDGSSDYNMYFRMGGGSNRGFVFKNGTSPRAQIDGAGNFYAVGVGHFGIGSVSGTHYDSFAKFIIESTEATLQICADNGGSAGAKITLTNESKHWQINNAPNDNRLEFRYGTTSASSDVFPNTSDMVYFTNAGSIVAAGSVSEFSDIRLKRDVQTIEYALDKVQEISGVTYLPKDRSLQSRRRTGVIAQEVARVLPEAVSKQRGGMMSVDYGNMVGLLVEAIKELRSELMELKSR